MGGELLEIIIPLIMVILVLAFGWIYSKAEAKKEALEAQRQAQLQAQLQAQKAQEAKERARQERKRKIDYYLNHPVLPQVVSFISEKGVPYKVVVNFDNVVAYHQGGTATFDFLTNGVASVESVGVYKKKKTAKIYYFAVALNQLLGNAFTVEERCDIHRYSDGEDFYNTLKCVELVRPLQEL